MAIDPGRFTRATIHSEAGEVEVRLSPQGNWQLNIRGADDREWRLACSGDLQGGAIAPKASASAPEPVRLGNLLVDTEGRRAFVDDTEVPLKARVFELLAMLASQPNRVFSGEELQRDAFGYDNVVPATRTVASHASRLRVKLREAGAKGLIVNCHGVGYKLWSEVVLTDASVRPAA